jgi:hypothetical protein
MAVLEKFGWQTFAIGLLAGAIAYLFVLPTRSVLGHDGLFHSGNPELGHWIKSLKNKEGDGCCDTADGYPAEARWDAKGGRYNVFIKGQWIEVPDSALLTGPNKLGYAMEWHYYVNGKPVVRCFLPGTLS